MLTVSDVTERLEAWLRQADFSGYDPFDGLNSRVFIALGLDRIAIARLAWLQFHKRSPINFRRLVGVPRTRNAKGVALMILGHLLRQPNQKLLTEATRLGQWLLDSRAADAAWAGESAIGSVAACWGYPFPWQARAFYVPIGMPNVIVTAYVAQALWQLARFVGQSVFSDAALQAGVFVAQRLMRRRGRHPFFSYVPSADILVHNANLWGAVTVARSGVALGRPDLTELACEAADLTVSSQRSDGAWVYGESPHHQFVDSFHTGFNIEALARLAELTGESRFRAAATRGSAYYKEKFFLASGVPRYYDDRTWPVDLHSAAQALVTAKIVGAADDLGDLASRVADWSVSHAFDSRRGRFPYQLTRWGRNDVPYLRWTQAWMYYALASYSAAEPLAEAASGERTVSSSPTSSLPAS